MFQKEFWAVIVSGTVYELFEAEYPARNVAKAVGGKSMRVVVSEGEPEYKADKAKWLLEAAMLILYKLEPLEQEFVWNKVFGPKLRPELAEELLKTWTKKQGL